MFNKFVGVFQARHFWRDVTYSELSALYISKILRLFALNIASIFILIYMYQTGYSLAYVVIYSGYYALLCTLFTPLAAIFTAQWGAKKILLVSSIVYIPALIVLSNIANWGEVSIMYGGFLQALAVIMYQVPHDVIFSEVKSTENAGKEISYMAIFEKVTAVVAPLVGGLLSSRYGPSATLTVSSVLFLVSTAPLFGAQGISKKNHYFNLSGFPFKSFWREFLLQISVGFEWLSTRLWPLFLIIVIFKDSDPYIMIGAFTALSALAALVVAYSFGRLIDDSHKTGRFIHHASSIGNALSMLWRSFLGGSVASVIANIIYNDAMVVSQNMTSLRAHFDSADRSGSRVVYLMMRHLCWNFFSFTACVVMSLVIFNTSTEALALRRYLLIASLVSSVYGLSNYRIYRKQVV